MRPAPKIARTCPPGRVRAARWLLDLLLPPRCVLCGAAADAAALCAPCARELPYLAACCQRCATPGTFAGGRCGACLVRPPGFAAALAALVYTWPVDRLVHAFKFQRDFAAGEVLGAALAEAAARLPPPWPDALVPVPLHFLRRARRGYNQSELLARRVAGVLRLPVRPALLWRSRHTPAQSGLDLVARRRNLRGAFGCRGVQGLRVALVDDVFTTGATLNECARTLRRCGAAEVQVWVAARVPHRILPQAGTAPVR